MKKPISIFLSILSVFSLTACQSTPSTENSGNSSASEQEVQHVHSLIKKASWEPTCLKDGNLAYWICKSCDAMFADHEGKEEVTWDDLVLEKLPHQLTKTEGIAPTCTKKGTMEYWSCSECYNSYADEACTEKIDKTKISVGMVDHSLIHHAEVLAQGRENGVKEHWSCEVCGGYFADEEGDKKITQMETILYSLLNIPDFIVEVPADRDPVVLQLTDTQIIYAENARPGRDGVHVNDWAKRNKDIRCYNYLRETIEAVNPDLIIMTGDNVYGEFDDNGEALTYLVEFMESFDIPWAPIFGNHDNESKMGVDWQCEQFEKAEHCLFEQKTLTGNGNYSVGIVQGGEIKRVFYMLDSNGCGNVSDESLANGHTTRDTGFGRDQIEWYTTQIGILKEASPDTKISFAYHIQQSIFELAYAQYGFNENTSSDNPIYVDRLIGKAEDDFGHIGSQLKGEWDADYSVWNGMKALGVDSVFVGHEHCISASVVYQGVRFQFGQKSTEYDRYNCLLDDGRIVNRNVREGTPLMGGSVIPLSKEDGSIVNPYIYYCQTAGGSIDWTQWVNTVPIYNA